ncbi:MAG: hypothetical protein AABX93_00970 [Nanoarchaeota archaeon]
MIQKAIIFDSGSLISLSMAGLFDELIGLKKIFKGKFLITKEIKGEIIDKPMSIKKYELEAIRLKELLDSGILEMPSSLKISDAEISKKTYEILEIANTTLQGRDRDIHLIDLGEASGLALSGILTEMGMTNIMAVDERTTRMLCEKPENLRKLMEGKLHTSIRAKVENYEFFKNFRFIRSTELIYVAYKKGIVESRDPKLLDALLYALKFKGAAISDEEISEIKRMG